MNPYDPLICLLLAVSYMGRAFQRQADNRNYFVVQVRFFSFFPLPVTHSRTPFARLHVLAGQTRYRVWPFSTATESSTQKGPIRTRSILTLERVSID
jgi:hypothetical protein